MSTRSPPGRRSRSPPDRRSRSPHPDYGRRRSSRSGRRSRSPPGRRSRSPPDRRSRSPHPDYGRRRSSRARSPRGRSPEVVIIDAPPPTSRPVRPLPRRSAYVPAPKRPNPASRAAETHQPSRTADSHPAATTRDPYAAFPATPLDDDPRPIDLPAGVKMPPRVPILPQGDDSRPVDLPTGVRMPPAATNHSATGSNRPKVVPAAPPTKKPKLNARTPPGRSMIDVLRIKFGQDVTGELRSTVRAVLGSSADTVVAAPSFRGYRGGPVDGTNTGRFLAPSAEWARWFCESWAVAVVRTQWTDSTAVYETGPLN